MEMTISTSQPPIQAFPSLLLRGIARFIGSYLTRERPTRLISRAEASTPKIGSTFCSRGPDRQLACPPLADDWLPTKGENSARKRVTTLRRLSTLLRTFPWRGGPLHEPA